jgi:FG-GAP-like repeat
MRCSIVSMGSVLILCAAVSAQGGAATFGAVTTMDLGALGVGACRHIELADFNGDNRLDAVTANPGTDDLSVLLQQANGTFTMTPYSGPTSGQIYSVSVMDMDLDGNLDLVNLNRTDPGVDVYIGNGNGTFGTTPVSTTMGVSNWPLDSGIDVADVDHDGAPDAVISENLFMVAIGDAAGGFSTWGQVSGTAGPGEVSLIDFDHDGHLDIVSSSAVNGDIELSFGNGAGTFASATTFSSPSTVSVPTGLSTGDLDMDSYDDVVVGDMASGYVDVWFNDAAGGLTGPTTHNLNSTFSRAYSTAIGEINEDGTPDLAIGGQTSGSVDAIITLTNNGSGTLGNSTTITLSSGPPASQTPYVAIGDKNSDGKNDVLCCTYGVALTYQSVFAFALSNTTNTDPWINYGQALAGTTLPKLVGSGALLANTPWTLTLSNALPSGSVYLVVGLNLYGQPFQGGILIPTADYVFGPFTTDANGSLYFATSQGGSPLQTSYYQYWIVDAAGPSGYSASNGIRAN